ncbi:MAG: site-specific integrase [Planctomycetota bacterium]|nr:site-specific integrase [Planctomycetota bacterium]
MSFNNSTSLEARVPVGLADAHVESFVNYLRTRGYSKRSLRRRRRTADSFTRWSRDKHLAVTDLDEDHITTFLKRSPPQNSKERFVRERAALRLFIRYLRDKGEVPPPRAASDSLPVDEFKQNYTDYLRKERGLAERSVCVYLPLIDDFLTTVMAQNDCKLLEILDATTVHDFLLDRVHDRSSEYTRLLLEARGIPGIRVLVGLLNLVHHHDSDSIDKACEIALTHNAFRLKTIRGLIQRGGPKQQELEFIDEHPIIRSMSDYEAIVKKSIR